jgi:hypothetical protein
VGGGTFPPHRLFTIIFLVIFKNAAQIPRILRGIFFAQVLDFAGRPRGTLLANESGNAQGEMGR